MRRTSNVLPRKYRFRILNACMSRFFKLAHRSSNGAAVPFKFIANDGNFVVNPITLTTLDQQGIAERYDIVVDFSTLPDRRPAQARQPARDARRRPRSEGDAVAGRGAGGRSDDDPVIGPMMEFRVVSSVPSVDAPGVRR